MNIANKNHSSRRLAWAVLFVVVAAALATVLIPAWLIQPFKSQTASGVELSYTLRSWAPLLTLAALLVAVWLSVWLWRGKRSWWRGGLLAAALVLVCAATWFARQNHFEWMFKPLPDAAYARMSEAGFVADKEMVLGIEINGEAAAYPVRQLAYHHVLHDTVGGVPIAATY